MLAALGQMRVYERLVMIVEESGEVPGSRERRVYIAAI